MLRGPGGGRLPGLTWAGGRWRPGAERTLICHRMSEWFNIRPLMDSERQMSRPRTRFPRRTSRFSRAGDAGGAGPATAAADGGPRAADDGAGPAADGPAAATGRASPARRPHAPAGGGGPAPVAGPGPAQNRVRG